MPYGYNVVATSENWNDFGVGTGGIRRYGVAPNRCARPGRNGFFICFNAVFPLDRALVRHSASDPFPILAVSVAGHRLAHGDRAVQSHVRA